MTPLIQEMVAMSPDAAVENHWFDMSSVYKKEQTINREILSRPLPYPQTALVCAYENKKVLLFVKNVGDFTLVAGLQFENKRPGDIPAFFYKTDDEGVKVQHKDGTPFDYRTSYATGVLAFICAFLESLQLQPAVAHTPIKRANWEKKIRQGKVPTYDWTTITIEPPAPKSDPQGGSHASPRWHERRGHWRLIKKTGKRVWVKNCEVGDKAIGAVFHDYKIAGQTNDI
jgi:hypothetical protein